MPSLNPRRISLLCLGILFIATANLLASDPRNDKHDFQYALYAPGGFSTKKTKVVLHPDPKQPKAAAIIGANGKFSDFAQWFYDIGSNPRNFEAWWRGYFTDPAIWKPGKTPVYEGTLAGNQGHRIIAWLGVMKKFIDKDPDIDPAVKEAFLNEAWKRAAEKTIGDTINDRGLMQIGPNIADMACHFHFIRTKFGAMGLRVDNIYTLDRAQNLIATLLTEPWTVSDEDKYLTPPSQDYLENLGFQAGGVGHDIRLIKDGKVLFSGGMFIGWKDKPALHGTWDGLAIINSLFKYYPDPDPASPKSIFYKWNKLPEDKTLIAKKMITLCSRRLWLDWKENKGPTWCWVANDVPTDDDDRPSEAPLLLAYDGYGDNQFGWAKACWEEMFGNPMRNTNDGVQSLLAIAHGTIHTKLKTPIGQQVPGRYDYDAATQKRLLEEDRKRLGLPPEEGSGATDETPKLKPEPGGKTPAHE